MSKSFTICALLSRASWPSRSSVASSLRVSFSRWFQISVDRPNRLINNETFITRIVVVDSSNTSSCPFASMRLLADGGRRSTRVEERQVFGIQEIFKFLLFGFLGQWKVLPLSDWRLFVWSNHEPFLGRFLLFSLLLTIFRLDLFVVQQQRYDLFWLECVRLEVATANDHSLDFTLLAGSLENSFFDGSLADESIHRHLLCLTQSMSAIHSLLVNRWVPV